MMRCCQLCLILVLISSISAEISISSSCESHCGNISIPYPFGIGKGCYLNEWYAVQCNNSVPYLPKINKEVVQIDFQGPVEFKFLSIPLGSLRIKSKIASMGCSGGDGKELEEVLNFTESPFSISRSNVLLAFGCNHKATLTHVHPGIVGCVSTCDQNMPRNSPSTSRCGGYMCCNAITPLEVDKKVGVKIESRDGGNTTTGGCGVAFLTDEFDQTLPPWGSRTDPKWFYGRQYSTVELEWEVQTNNTISFKDSVKCGNLTLLLNEFHSGSDTPSDDFHSRPCYCDELEFDDRYLRCACTDGYEGNPYLPDDCKDIDECKILDAGRRPKFCINGETCLNTPGGHQCVIKKSKTFLIYIGVSIGVSVLLVGACIWLYKYVKKQRKIRQRQTFFKRNGGLLLQQQLSSGEGSVDKTIVFSSKELEKATESFSSERVLGEGGQGTVYKGMLGDGRIVAVKKSKALDQDQVQEFINELVILSQINHRNIVSIIGCCLETEVPVLVYEFIPNGNLFQHLQNQLDDDQTVATWEVRLRIAIDIAGPLSYLHSAASSPIYHKDIKSTNIMLDAKYRAKLSDFGISRVIAVDDTHLTTVVKGTAGYVDPEYYQSGQYTEKSDVYSYGVVLAELITGEKPVSSQRPQHIRTLATYFLVAMRDDRLFDIIDPRIRDGCMLEQVKVMAKIARLCLNLTGERRPTMRDILAELERIRSSSHGESLHLDCIVENDEEEDQAVEVISRRETFNIDVASTSASQYDDGAAMSTDVEPLFPQTW